MTWWQWIVAIVGGGALILAVWHYGSMIKPINRLLNDASNGKVDKVRRRLDQGMDVNGRGAFGMTPLAAAIGNKKWEVARLLLERGARVEGTIVKTPLIVWVADEGQAELARLLLEHGADPNVFGLGGFSALSSAVDVGDRDTVAALLDHGADMSRATAEGMPALVRAVAKGNLPIIELLLERGADPNDDRATSPPLIVALGSAHEETRTVRHESERWFGVVEALLRAGADPNRSDEASMTPLLLATAQGQPKMLKLMLDHGGQPLARTARGFNAWEIARALGDERVLEVLGPEPTSSW